MDVPTVDRQYEQLQAQAQQTVQELQGLAGKLKTASQAGDLQAREWLLDLRSIALAIKSEQDQVSSLLQALHGYAQTQAATQQQIQPSNAWGQQPPSYAPAPYPPQNYPPQAYPPPQYPQPGYPPPDYAPQQGYAPQGFQPQQSAGIGGMLGGFLNSSFGRAIETGAGFGIGDDLIKKIF